MLKELKDVEKVKKIMCEQSGTINQDRKSKNKTKRNSEAEKSND